MASKKANPGEDDAAALDGLARLIVDEEGDPVDLSPVQGDKDYTEVLPQVHFVYRLDDSSNLRAAITRSLARPNFEDVAPWRLINREDEEIELGNPDLDVTTAWNLDLMYERFFTTVGVVSAGVFYKDLQDYIFVSTFEEIRDGDVWEITQPLNGDNATLWGLELAYQNQFRNAPGFLSGFGIYLNYTWTDSEATIPGHDGDSPLPGQPDEVGNIAISYEKGFFSGILSYNIQGEWLEEVGGDHQIGPGLGQALSRAFRLRQHLRRQGRIGSSHDADDPAPQQHMTNI